MVKIAGDCRLVFESGRPACGCSDFWRGTYPGAPELTAAEDSSKPAPKNCTKQDPAVFQVKDCVIQYSCKFWTEHFLLKWTVQRLSSHYV